MEAKEEVERVGELSDTNGRSLIIYHHTQTNIVATHYILFALGHRVKRMYTTKTVINEQLLSHANVKENTISLSVPVEIL